MPEKVVVFVRPGDPGCQSALIYLQERNVDFAPVDITADPQAAELLMNRLGKVVTPTFLIGDKVIVGFDPVQLSRYLPKPPDAEAKVSFGAAVRTVSTEVAQAHGLTYSFGVEVGTVREGSPAALAGIEDGDLITQIGAYSITRGEQQFRTAIAGRSPGDKMTLTVVHGSDAREVTVQFPAENAPDESATAAVERT